MAATKKPKPVYAFEWRNLDWGLTDEELAEGLGIDAEEVRLHRPVGRKPDYAGLEPVAPLVRYCLPPEPEADEGVVYIKVGPPKVQAKLEEGKRGAPKPAPPSSGKTKPKAKKVKRAPRKAEAKPAPKPTPTPEEKAAARVKAAVRQVADCTVVVRLEIPKKLHDLALAAAAGGADPPGLDAARRGRKADALSCYVCRLLAGALAGFY